jgi:hypothetical protein
VASLTLTMDCTILPDDTSQIVGTVTLGSGIPNELFLFSRGVTAPQDAYQGVASPYEVSKYPAARDPAYDFYRLATATLTFATAAAGAAGKLDLPVRVQAVLDAYEEVSGFIGTTATAMTSA